MILVEVRKRPQKGQDPYRTGNAAYLKRHVAKDIFSDMDVQDVAFVEIGVLDKLREMLVVQDDKDDEHDEDNTNEEIHEE